MTAPLGIPPAPPPPPGPSPTQRTSDIIGTFRPTKVTTFNPSNRNFYFQAKNFLAIQAYALKHVYNLSRLRRFGRVSLSSYLERLSPSLQRQRRKVNQNTAVTKIWSSPCSLHPSCYFHNLCQHEGRRLYSLPFDPRQCVPALLPRPH